MTGAAQVLANMLLHSLTGVFAGQSAFQNTFSHDRQAAGHDRRPAAPEQARGIRDNLGVADGALDLDGIGEHVPDGKPDTLATAGAEVEVDQFLSEVEIDASHQVGLVGAGGVAIGGGAHAVLEHAQGNRAFKLGLFFVGARYQG